MHYKNSLSQGLNIMSVSSTILPVHNSLSHVVLSCNCWLSSDSAPPRHPSLNNNNRPSVAHRACLKSPKPALKIIQICAVKTNLRLYKLNISENKIQIYRQIIYIKDINVN